MSFEHDTYGGVRIDLALLGFCFKQLSLKQSIDFLDF